MTIRMHILNPTRRHEGGAALLTALILLIAVTLLTLSALGTSLLELRMANNDEMQMSALETAQSAVDNVIAIHAAASDIVNPVPEKQYFKLSGLVNSSNCTPSWTAGACTTQPPTIGPLTAPLDGSATGGNKVRITRTTDSIPQGPTKCRTAAAFTIESTYDVLGKGRSDVTQGYLLCDHLGTEMLTEGCDGLDCGILNSEPPPEGRTPT